jgi:hypothetical protein
MRSTGFAAMLLMLGCSAAVVAQAGSKAAIEKALIANENKINEAVAKHDVKTFNDLVASDAISADGMGVMKVADFVKSINDVKIGSWHIMDTQVHWVDDKTAVVTYTWMGSGSFKGEPVPPTTYASSEWTERNGKWDVVYHQESAAAPPPPAKKK